MGNRGTEGNRAAAALDGCHQGTDPFVRAVENNKGELVCTTVSFQSRRFLSGGKASSQGKEKVQRLLKAASKEKCSDAMLDFFSPPSTLSPAHFEWFSISKAVSDSNTEQRQVRQSLLSEGTPLWQIPFVQDQRSIAFDSTWKMGKCAQSVLLLRNVNTCNWNKRDPKAKCAPSPWL